MRIKIKFIISFLLVILVLNGQLFSQIVMGEVTDSDTNSLPYATVFVKNTTLGTTTNFEGKYFFSLKPGNYTLVYSFMGHVSQEKNISIIKGQKIVLDVDLKYDDIQIHGVEIVANKVDKAKSILDIVRKKRRFYLTNVNDYECLSYAKTSIEKLKQRNDSNAVKIDKNEDFTSYMNRENMNLIEYVARIYHKKPNKRKSQILAYHDFSMKRPPDFGIFIEAGYGEHDIASKAYVQQNPYLFDENNLEFDFYENLLDFPGLCEQPLVSPISATSALNYKFIFVNSFYEDSVKINKIEVIPRNKIDALFYGFIYIDDDKSALKAVNLSINEAALSVFQNFNIIQDYTQINDSIFLPNKTEVKYLIKEGKDKILGYSNIFRKDYKVNQNLSNKMFTNEVKIYNFDAYDKDSLYWANNRLTYLKEKELLFIKKSDSVQEYYISDAYLDKRDSLFNKFSWWSPFFGFGHRNHRTGNEYYIGGLVEQINPFGIGGYRHKLTVSYKKRFKNDMVFETKPMIDYGFANKDVKGKIGLGFTYLPMKFMRTYIEVGNFYDMINNYASFEQVFSRSNYVNTKSFMIQQRLEIINGLYTEISFIYSSQDPISDLQLASWSNIFFGDLNTPLDFNQYIKTEAKIEFKYVVGQKYMIMKNRKIVVEDNYPEISLIYRKGIPNLFGSEVNFDYLELNAKADVKLARFGTSKGQIKGGIFLNKANLRLLEYKYFRGSDMYLFSNPILSLQLLPSTFSTNNEFLQLNYIHHFNGSLLNRVPLF
ncbi:MAG: DUF5686 and carboxypeptidase regulatory-like domain-containing protein, partial [Bacteroidota bacterium]|nr:DUF5686 and carboxypeptidase regulatory-like domain-containing protein [Bacteroidota bacterium]